MKVTIKTSERKTQIIGNKIKGRILKRMLKENTARQVFRKTNISYSLIRSVAVRIRGHEIVVFRKILRAFFSCNIRFVIFLFSLITDKMLYFKNWLAPRDESFSRKFPEKKEIF